MSEFKRLHPTIIHPRLLRLFEWLDEKFTGKPEYFTSPVVRECRHEGSNCPSRVFWGHSRFVASAYRRALEGKLPIGGAAISEQLKFNVSVHNDGCKSTEPLFQLERETERVRYDELDDVRHIGGTITRRELKFQAVSVDTPAGYVLLSDIDTTTELSVIGYVRQRRKVEIDYSNPEATEELIALKLAAAKLLIIDSLELSVQNAK